MGARPPTICRGTAAPTTALLRRVGGAALLTLALAPPALAQPPGGAPSAGAFGFYLNLFWLLLMIVSAGAWLYGTAWVVDDAMGAELNYLRWGGWMLGTGAIGALLMVFVHAAFGTLLIAAAGAVGALYIKERNRVVPDQFRLFRKKRQKGSEVPGERERLSVGLENESHVALTDLVAEHPEYAAAGGIIADLIMRAALCKARTVRLEPAAGNLVARFDLDGVMQNVEFFPEEQGRSLLSCLARFAGLGSRGKSSAVLNAKLPGEEPAQIEVRGLKTERGPALLMAMPDWTKDLYRMGLQALGMHQSMAEKLEAALTTPGTAILFSGPRRSGRTSTLYAAVGRIDIFTTDVFMLEQRIQHELPQVMRREVDLRSPQTFREEFKAVLREEPHVVAVDELTGCDVVRPLFEFAAEGGRLLATILASNSGEAVRRVLLSVEAGLASRTLSAVLNQRLVRKLCDQCKEPAEPSPRLLQKLGIEPDKAGQWFRAVGCDQCLNTGYLGRTALFEMLIVNDDVRKVIAAGPTSADAIQRAAGKAGLRTLHADGLLKVRQGVTTLEEVRRVLKR